MYTKKLVGKLEDEYLCKTLKYMTRCIKINNKLILFVRVECIHLNKDSNMWQGFCEHDDES